MRQEVVSDEEAHEHKVVDHALQVEGEGQGRGGAEAGELHVEILPEHAQLEQLQRFHGHTSVAVAEDLDGGGRGAAAALAARLHDLSEDVEVRLVRGEPQHDEVGVQAVEDVAGVGVVPRLRALRPHELHDLVLSLAGDGGVAEDHLEPAPARVQREALVHVVPQPVRQTGHEGGSRRDDVVVEHLLLGAALAELVAALHHLATQVLLDVLLLRDLLGRLEAAGALLVHLRARRDTVDGHVQHLAGAHHRHEAVDVKADVGKHLVLGLGGRDVFRVHARVDDAVHIEVQVVKLDAVGVGLRQVHRHRDASHGRGLLLEHVSQDARVLLDEPSEECWHAHPSSRPRGVPRAQGRFPARRRKRT